LPTVSWWPKRFAPPRLWKPRAFPFESSTCNRQAARIREAIRRAAAETGAIVVAEEHLVDGGLGVRVAQVVANRSLPMNSWACQDTYANTGQPAELLEKYRLDASTWPPGAPSGCAQAIIHVPTAGALPMPSSAKARSVTGWWMPRDASSIFTATRARFSGNPAGAC